MSDDTKTVQGVVKSWQDKPSGWTDFQILFVGRSNPTKVSTDDADLVAQVKALSEGEATNFTFAESEGRINERTGKPYINRYLREVGGNAPAADAGSTGSQPAGPSAGPREYTPEEIQRFDEKERREFRSRAWAHTMSAQSHMIKVDDAAQDIYNRLKPLQVKIYEDIMQSAAYAVDDDIGYPDPAGGQDDIPF